jgi:DNA-binding transcriptional ArsR family regulator
MAENRLKNKSRAEKNRISLQNYTRSCNNQGMSQKNTKTPATCRPKPALSGRKLIDTASARHLGDLFKVLTNETRIRIIHALARSEELCVSELCEELGMKPQAVSNQLQKLSAAKLVASRRDGNQIIYSILDPCVPTLLHTGLCLLEDAE